MLSLYPSATQKARLTRRYAPCKPNPRPAPPSRGENRSLSRCPALYPAHLRRLPFSRHVLWVSHAQPGVFGVVPPVHEHVHLCRLHGVCRQPNLLLLPTFQPLHAFLLTLMVNARHLFYGLSMLDKFKNLGWKKPYLIFGLCDETFSIHCAVTPPAGIDRGGSCFSSPSSTRSTRWRGPPWVPCWGT